MGKRKSSVKVGDRFGTLKVIKELPHTTEPNGHRRHTVEVECDCGRRFDIKSIYLKRGQKTCINCKGKEIRACKLGDKFDKLTVIGHTKNKDSNRLLVVCKCDCGNIS